jgi:parvulin-like peptidyl-prolyl isomerase
MRFHRFAPVVILFALGLLLAGCGGGSKSVPTDAVATVGSDTITKAQFNQLLTGEKLRYTANKTAFPRPGTTQYKQLQDRVMQYLVQESELSQKAKDLGVTVTAKDVDQKVAEFKKQYFGGNEKSYKAGLKQQGMTDSLFRFFERGQVLSDKLYAKVTGDVKVTDGDIQKYYEQNKSLYGTPASRDVRHILVNSKKLADQLETQLKHGADFGKLAKKYSKDTASAVNGGKLTISQGKTVPPFDKAAFSLKVNEISAPVHSQYGWHIIQALSAIKPAKTTPLKDVKEQIRQQLLQSKKMAKASKWLADTKKEFEKSIHYQAGYVPETTSTASATTSTTG